MIRVLPVSLFVSVASVAEVVSLVTTDTNTATLAAVIFFNSLALAAVFVPVLIWQVRKITQLEARVQHLTEINEIQRNNAGSNYPTFGVEEMIQEPLRLPIFEGSFTGS